MTTAALDYVLILEDAFLHADPLTLFVTFLFGTLAVGLTVTAVYDIVVGVIDVVRKRRR